MNMQVREGSLASGLESKVLNTIQVVIDKNNILIYIVSLTKWSRQALQRLIVIHI